MKNLTDRDLDRLLAEWRVPQPDGENRETFAVWRRIALREAEMRESLWWGARLSQRLVRPAFACATVVVFVLAGLVLAEVRIQREEAANLEVLEAQYFRAIDPVSMASHRHRK
jgi:hypothetical protein